MHDIIAPMQWDWFAAAVYGNQTTYFIFKPPAGENWKINIPLYFYFLIWHSRRRHSIGIYVYLCLCISTSVSVCKLMWISWSLELVPYLFSRKLVSWSYLGLVCEKINSRHHHSAFRPDNNCSNIPFIGSLLDLSAFHLISYS